MQDLTATWLQSHPTWDNHVWAEQYKTLGSNSWSLGRPGHRPRQGWSITWCNAYIFYLCIFCPFGHVHQHTWVPTPLPLPLWAPPCPPCHIFKVGWAQYNRTDAQPVLESSLAKQRPCVPKEPGLLPAPCPPASFKLAPWSGLDVDGRVIFGSKHTYSMLFWSGWARERSHAPKGEGSLKGESWKEVHSSPLCSPLALVHKCWLEEEISHHCSNFSHALIKWEEDQSSGWSGWMSDRPREAVDPHGVWNAPTSLQC